MRTQHLNSTAAVNPNFDDGGREIHLRDIVVADGPRYGRVIHIREGGVLIRSLDFEVPYGAGDVIALQAGELTVVDSEWKPRPARRRRRGGV